jgi:hypothetical protein
MSMGEAGVIDVIGLVLGPAIIAAIVTLGYNYWSKRREDRQARTVSALLLAMDLEAYAYRCAGKAYDIEHNIPRGKPLWHIPLLLPYPQDLQWGLLPPRGASNAATLATKVTIAIGVIMGTQGEALRVVQARRLCSELGLEAWAIASELRKQAADLPGIEVSRLNWNFELYLNESYWKAVDDLKERNFWNHSHDPSEPLMSEYPAFFNRRDPKQERTAPHQ